MCYKVAAQSLVKQGHFTVTASVREIFRNTLFSILYFSILQNSTSCGRHGTLNTESNAVSVPCILLLRPSDTALKLH